MRSFLVYLISTLVFLFSLSLVQADQSGPGNGTDYVKILFADAQYDVARSLSALDDASLPALGLPAEALHWLQGRSQGASRFERLKFWLRRMDLRFQSGPCSDASGKPASICFFGAPNDPFVLISLEQNRMTTRDQAMAMLIHEAGHFAGEPDHLLLDRVGVALVAAAKVPAALFADAESTVIVANPFQAEADCNAGEGAQAKALRAAARLALLRQCSDRGISCDEKRAEYAYQGENLFRAGQGFEMKVRCLVRAVLPLR